MKLGSLFATLGLLLALPCLAQSGKPRPAPPHVRLLTKTQGRQIVRAISSAEAETVAESDCSHLVHHLYEQAGFPYDYASSRDLYFGAPGFVRVRSPQFGDLVVWIGHVGVVTDPKRHAFFSSVSDGPGTQAYNSAYWRSRGTPRFFRYALGRQVRSDSAAVHPDY